MIDAMAPAVALLALLVSPQQQLSPADPNLRYIGRWDVADPNGPRGSWPASAVELRFEGAKAVFRLSDSTGKDWIEAELDGKPVLGEEVAKEPKDYTVQAPAAGTHLIKLIKRTEPFVGTLQLLEVRIPGGRATPPVRPSRRIEIVGDSISCGFGNEGRAATDPFRPATENAAMTYGWLAAKRLGADCVVIAWSGRKMWPDNTVPAIYDLAVPTDPASRWDFHSPPPQAVIINLATNDFSRANPDEKEWTGAYRQFIGRLRTHYPGATVYCAIGSMMSDTFPPERRALSTLRAYLSRMVGRMKEEGDKKVHVLEFAQQRQEDGIGAAWHPSVRTHLKMADVLVAALRRDLHW